MDLRTELERFISTELVADGEARPLSPDDDLLDGGIIDSAGILQLVGHLEERFGFQVSDDELTAENFRTIDDLARFVEAKNRAQH
jgi:acyl carrier protein